MYRFVSEEEKQRFRELYEAGRLDYEIAKAIGVSDTTVTRWRKKEGLPRNQRKKYSAEEARVAKNYNAKRTREYMIATQRCCLCHKQDAYTLNGRHYCADCTERRRQHSKRYWERHRDEINERRRKRSAEKYHERKEAGLCVYCGKPSGSYAKCKQCRAKEMSWYVKRMIARGENYPRGDNGFCWKCNKVPAEEGKRFCAECSRKFKAIRFKWGCEKDVGEGTKNSGNTHCH